VSLRDLPALNATLNATSALLLFLGFALVRSGRREAHRKAMLAAVVTSTVFLLCYLVYHFEVGSVRFTRGGPIRSVYLAILGSHTVLAAAVGPLVLVTLRRALRGRLEEHRRLARVTLPLWAYVSLSGVVIYWMLYRL
jgi:uncharacterized membrane protein YozB (DUF420 family)